MMKKPVIYIYVNNHFDPTWRRCWDHRFTFKGETFISYADLQEYYLLDNIELARKHPEYKFEAEYTLVVRKFLERHPEMLDECRELVREGRFGVTGGGEVIVDANMILGESLVRNYLYGLLWVEDHLQQKTRIIVRNDAFGNSAQLPQIIRGCDVAWATGMSYSPANGKYWRGLDGSTVLHTTVPTAAWGGGNTKYPPCPSCRGSGKDLDGGVCNICRGRGINVFERAWLPGKINPGSFKEFGCALVPMTPEELLPNPDLVEWASRVSQDYEVRFALEEDLIPVLRSQLKEADDAPKDLIHTGIELNPNNSGCWVTRIKTKQTCRRQEYDLLATEKLWVFGAVKGYPYPLQEFLETWQRLLFTMFHDAITATHVDPAYQELQQAWLVIDENITNLREQAFPILANGEPELFSVINPSGEMLTTIGTITVSREDNNFVITDDQGNIVPIYDVHENDDGTIRVDFAARDIPGDGSRTYRFGPGLAIGNVISSLPQPRIENERFLIEGDDHGLLSIYDRLLNQTVLQHDEYHPGELILELDEGSPWATLNPDQKRTTLSVHTQLLAVEQTASMQRITYEVETPHGMGFAGQCLKGRSSVTLYAGIERVEFQLAVHWSAFNHRLRVAMPVPARGRSIYDIPYGFIERQSYEPTFDWAGANGDWPALNWAGVQTSTFSAALLNKGLVSYRIEPGKNLGEVILLSVLRSPTIPTYLHEPQFYSMTEWDGMRDEGDHIFEYAITVYREPFTDSRVVLDAEIYNAGVIVVPGLVSLPDIPRIASECVRVAALKWAEKERALILRLCEYRGKGGKVDVAIPSYVKAAAKVNLLEQKPQILEIEGAILHCYLRPWEIATFQLLLNENK
jgi:alpha-mannosidase